MVKKNKQQATRLRAEAEEKRKLRNPPPSRDPLLKKDIILETKRGSRVFGYQCDCCGYSFYRIRRYSKSNYGVVFICDACLNTTMQQSFDDYSADAFSAAYQGGDCDNT